MVNGISRINSNWGITGYHLPKQGLLPSVPKISVGKEKNQDYMTKIIKKGSETPAPNEHVHIKKWDKA